MKDLMRQKEIMEEISQRCYCAVWLEDLEYILWNQVINFKNNKVKKDIPWGQSEIKLEEIKQLHTLSNKTQLWWDGQIAIPLETWKKEADGNKKLLSGIEKRKK